MDYVVIGAGPAGLQLGYFLQQPVATSRLPEDICNDWTDEKVYREPLRAFVEAPR